MRPTEPIDLTSPAVGFFANLPKIDKAERALDLTAFFPAPDDWHLVSTDVRGSTAAVSRGEHKTVNFVAASSIAALKNICSPVPIPFLFGGDGATIMVPDPFRDRTRLALARVRRFVKTDFGLDLAVGCVQVADLRRRGHDVRVARYEPTPGNHFGVFAGGGVSSLERAIKGRGDDTLQRLSLIPESLDDGGAVDLTGLSCRWDRLQSKRGKMLSVIVFGAEADLRDIYGRIQRMAAGGRAIAQFEMASLAPRWPPPGFVLEAKARRKAGPLWLATARVLAETLLAYVLFLSSTSLGTFDPNRYKSEILANTDFCHYDDGLFFVVDCAATSIADIANYLADRSRTGSIRFGLNVSDAALMTCLVTSPGEGLHVHFVDGESGGYTRAAEMLKGNLTLEDVIGTLGGAGAHTE